MILEKTRDNIHDKNNEQISTAVSKMTNDIGLVVKEQPNGILDTKDVPNNTRFMAILISGKVYTYGKIDGVIYNLSTGDPI